MKNLAVSLCLFALSASTFAVTDSYVARLDESGRYCAKVNVGIIGAPYFKTKCYTLEGWEARGFTVEAQ